MKYLLYSLFGLVLGLVSVGFLVPLIIDINQYKNYFSDYIKNKSGFNIEILGNLDLKIFPSPKIQISEVNISQSINEEEHQVASIGEMTASFDLPSLVYAKFKIKSMKFDGLDILIDNENTSVFSNSIAKNKKERENFSNELNANNNTKKNNTTKPFFSVEIDKVSFLDSRLNK